MIAETFKQDEAKLQINAGRAFYEALRGITLLMKTEMMSVLDLEIPQALEGDND